MPAVVETDHLRDDPRRQLAGVRGDEVDVTRRRHRSARSAAMARTRGSNSAIRLGRNARLTRVRRRVCSAPSLVIIPIRNGFG